MAVATYWEFEKSKIRALPDNLGHPYLIMWQNVRIYVLLDAHLECKD